MKNDPKVLEVLIPRYRKAVLTGDVAIRLREPISHSSVAHERGITSGKPARDHVHVFLSYRPTQKVSQTIHWLKGTSSGVLLQESPRLRKRSWGVHRWARGLQAVSSRKIKGEVIREGFCSQEGDRIVNESRFPIHPT